MKMVVFIIIFIMISSSSIVKRALIPLLLLLAVTLAKNSTKRGPLAVHLCMKHHLHRCHFDTKQISVGHGGKFTSNPRHNQCGDILCPYVKLWIA